MKTWLLISLKCYINRIWLKNCNLIVIHINIRKNIYKRLIKYDGMRTNALDQDKPFWDVLTNHTLSAECQRHHIYSN